MERHFLIYTNRHKDPKLEVTERIRSFLEQRGQRVSLRILDRDWKEESEEEAVSIPPDADIMLVLGGDGTVLQAARETIHFHIPMIGVNLGTLGYITQIETAGLDGALERLMTGDYRMETRMLLQGKALLKDGALCTQLALNDIVISRKGSLRVISLQIYVNGIFLHEYHADGIIVTTPTGSTGYNLSAGGPLVEPSAKLIMLTPICPHTLNQRSIILSPEDEIEIRIPLGKEDKEQELEASFDGAHVLTMRTGDRILISRSEECAQFIQLSRISFLETLHQKMN